MPRYTRTQYTYIILSKSQLEIGMEQLCPRDFGETNDSAFEHNFIFKVVLPYTESIQTISWDRSGSVLP